MLPKRLSGLITVGVELKVCLSILQTIIENNYPVVWEPHVTYAESFSEADSTLVLFYSPFYLDLVSMLFRSMLNAGIKRKCNEKQRRLEGHDY
jgi:hypothetical protein